MPPSASTSQRFKQHACRCEVVQEGDEVEVLVLSKTMYCDEFDVVRDVYVPASGAWLCDYPFVKRLDFERISADIYRSRQGQQEGGDAGPSQMWG